MKEYNFENFCLVKSSKRIFANQYTNAGIPFYRGKEITLLSMGQSIYDLLYISEQAFQQVKTNGMPENNDILITAVGTIGSIWLVDTNTPFYFKDGNIIWLSKINQNIVLPKYLKYAMISSRFQKKIEEVSIGSNQKALTIDSVKKLQISFPKIETQQHIVDILGSIDEKIENNEILIQKIEEKVLLEYDRINTFEPLSEIVMSDCFDITIGKTPPRKESHLFTQNSTDVKWLSISDLGKSSVFCFDTSERITPEGISKYNVKVVPKNTVVLSFKLTVGKVAITGCDMATNEAIAHFNSSNHCLLEYLYCYLKRYNFDTLGNTSSIATAVNSKTIKAMHFFIPDDTMLENFHHKTLPLFENIRQLLIENQKLNELKQLYLKKFFG